MRNYRIPLHTISLVRERSIQAEDKTITQSDHAIGDGTDRYYSFMDDGKLA